MFVVMLVNAGVIVVESWQDFTDAATPLTPIEWAWVDSAFALLYVLNIVAQLSVTPFDRYWMRAINRFAATR